MKHLQNGGCSFPLQYGDSMKKKGLLTLIISCFIPHLYGATQTPTFVAFIGNDRDKRGLDPLKRFGKKKPTIKSQEQHDREAFKKELDSYYDFVVQKDVSEKLMEKKMKELLRKWGAHPARDKAIKEAFKEYLLIHHPKV